MKNWIKRSAALALAAALMPATVSPAPADGWRGPGFGAGVAAGILGLGVMGAIEAERERDYYYGNYGPACHPGPLECRMYDSPCFHDEYGAYYLPAAGAALLPPANLRLAFRLVSGLPSRLALNGAA